MSTCPHMREAEEQTAAVMASGKPHALLFDCDGTLVDTMPMYLKSWTLTLAELDLPPLPAERFYSLGGMPVGKIFEMLLAEAGNTTITVEKCEETKRKHHQGLVERGEGVPPGIDVVIEFARKYKQLGVPVAVCSSGWRDHVIGNLEACGALDLFTEVVTADDPDLKNGKPAPDIWLIAARRLNVPIENCVGFEDAPLGMESLQAAGVKFAADVTVWADYPRNVEARAREAAAA